MPQPRLVRWIRERVSGLGILAARGVSMPFYPTGTRDQVSYFQDVLDERDVSLCMLPLSHVFERIRADYVLCPGAENACIRDPPRSPWLRSRRLSRPGCVRPEQRR